jgi:putative YjhG/YagF family dehydratase
MMMALASLDRLPGILVPGGVTLPPDHGEDAGKIQSLSARFAQGEVTLEYAQEMGCRACGSSGGGCQFLGTAATSQVVGEALGLTVPHAALAPSGEPIWRDLARVSARALLEMEKSGLSMKNVLTDAAVRNAMVVHAAFGGSTNLLIHIPAIAHAAGLKRPTVNDWIQINRQVPRLVDAIPNGPVGYPTVQVFLAGGVPEVMLHLRDLGLLDVNVATVSGRSLDEVLDAWTGSTRRSHLRALLRDRDGIDPDDVILEPERAKERGLTSTVTFPIGNLAPDGSVVKSTAIDPTVVDADGVYRKRGPARLFSREREAVEAIKDGRVGPGDVVVLMCSGPMGSGMEESAQVTSALRYVSWGKEVALITDARFSGFSSGACIGHVGPEALAGGPISRLREDDIIEITIDLNRLDGSIHLVGEAGDDEAVLSTERGNELLRDREMGGGLRSHPEIPDDTRLWAALQDVSGGTWGGCVFDVDAIIERLGQDLDLKRDVE